jgi:hypothetical protein
LENSLGAVWLERWSWWSPTIFRYIPIPAVALSSNLNYNKPRIPILKINKMKNITKSIIALFAVVALSCSVEDVQTRNQE